MKKWRWLLRSHLMAGVCMAAPTTFYVTTSGTGDSSSSASASTNILGAIGYLMEVELSSLARGKKLSFYAPK